MSEKAVNSEESCDLLKSIKEQLPLVDATAVNAPPANTPEIFLSRPQFLYAFAILYMLFLLDFAARLGVVAVFPIMQAELGFSDSQLGFIGSVVLMGMSLFVLPFAYLADKTSKKHAITAMATVWGVGSILCGLFSSFIAVVLGRLMVGMGNASYAPVSVSMLTPWTPKSRWGTTIGVYNSSMALGMAAGTTVSGVLGSLYGWRVPFLLIGAMTLVFAVLSLTLPKSSKAAQKAKPKINLKEAISVTLQNKALLFISIGAGLSNLALASLTTWRPMYLVRTLEWTPAEVGAILGPVYLLMGVCITPLSGVISDKLVKIDNRARAWLAVPVLLLTAAINVVAFKSGSFTCILIAMLIATIPFAGFHIATQEIVPARYRASAYGTYVIFLQGFGFLGPLIAGGLSQSFGLNVALVYIQGAFVVAVVCFFIAGFLYRRDYAKAKAMDAAYENTK